MSVTKKYWIVWGVLCFLAGINLIGSGDAEPYVAGSLVVAALMAKEDDEQH